MTIMEEVFRDFRETKIKFMKERGGLDMPRNYFRKNSKLGAKYESLGLTYTQLNEMVPVRRGEKEKSSRYFISSIVAGQQIDKSFLNAIMRYCRDAGAKLILVPVKGVHGENTFDQNIAEDWGKYFAEDITFNKNIRLCNMGLTANNSPIFQLKKLGNMGYSVIVGSPFQRLEVVAASQNPNNHILYSTGTVSNMAFRKSVSGFVNEKTFKKGGLVLEIENSKIFHVRNVEFLQNYFVDINKAYYSDRTENIRAAAFVAGDLHASGDEDALAIKALKEQIFATDPENVFLHDITSHNSINKHERDSFTCGASKRFMTIKEEHRYNATFLQNLIDASRKWYIVKSNHDEWLSQYLSSRETWIREDNNAKYAFELCGKLLEGKDPLEYALKHNVKYLVKGGPIFLQRRDSMRICGFELAFHGDKGPSGSPGNLNSLEKCLGKCIIGHSHSPKIGTVGVQVGTNTKLNLRYTEGGVNGWANANVALFPNGSFQMLISINGEWKND